MSWGALGGLGQAFTNMASNMAEMDKAKLRDKLEADRELARETRAEARTKRTVADRRLEKVGEKYMWREVNSYGEPIREVEASPEEVKKIENEAKLSDLNVRKGTAEATVAEVTAADAPAAVERTIATHNSNLASAEETRRASRDASARGWESLELEKQRNDISERGLAGKLTGAKGSNEKPTELSAVARQLRSDYDKLVTSLMEDPTVNLTETDAQALARNSAVNAAKLGKDFGDVYRRALEDFAKLRRAKAK